MECPHCRAEITATPHFFALGEDQDGTWQVSNLRCPTCDHLIIELCTKQGCTYPAWPVSSTRPRLSDDVPADYAAEYHTASQVIFYSSEASAAISRRSLHRFLATKVHAGHGGLADQIRQADYLPRPAPHRINGLPVATFELKNRLTKQTVQDAVQQYKRDRDPKELLFQFARCMVHFAVDDQVGADVHAPEGERLVVSCRSTRAGTMGAATRRTRAASRRRTCGSRC